jgi:hypothetical protein
MKGLDKLTYPRLAEALIQRGSVDQALIRQLLQESERSRQPLPELLVRDELFSEWELVRLVADHFTLPIVYPLQYELDNNLLKKFGIEVLRQKNLLPLAKFGDIVTMAMPILTPVSELQELEREHKIEIFPFTAPISENSQILMEQGGKGGKKSEALLDSSWEKLFDEAEATLQEGALPG